MSDYIVYIIPAPLLLIFVYYYNRLIRRSNTTKQAFASVDVMLKRRFDLIPNLVKIVKQYMEYESATLAEIVKIRTGYNEQKAIDEKVEIHNDISKKMGAMLLQMEKYPELKADKNFVKLQAAINETEEQIAASRLFYNAAVTHYNNSVQLFPSSIIATLFGFKSKPVFVILQSETAPADVESILNGE